MGFGLNSRDPCRRHHDGTQSRALKRYGCRDRHRQAQADSRHQPGGKQRSLTTSVFSGRSRRTALLHRRRSWPSTLRSVGEHFGRGDHFAHLHPICTHLQGVKIPEALTAPRLDRGICLMVDPLASACHHR